MAIIQEAYDLTQTLENTGSINFRQENIQFNPISQSDDRVVINDGDQYLVLKLGIDFVSTYLDNPAPVFLLDGNATPFEVKTNIVDINPSAGTVQFIAPPDTIYTAYVSTIFINLADEGKQLTATVYSAQSVYEAWMLNKTADVINNYVPYTPLTVNGTSEINNIVFNNDMFTVNSTIPTSLIAVNIATDLDLGVVIPSDVDFITTAQGLVNLSVQRVLEITEAYKLVPPIGLDITKTYNLTVLNGVYTWQEDLSEVRCVAILDTSIVISTETEIVFNPTISINTNGIKVNTSGEVECFADGYYTVKFKSYINESSDPVFSLWAEKWDAQIAIPAWELVQGSLNKTQKIRESGANTASFSGGLDLKIGDKIRIKAIATSGTVIFEETTQTTSLGTVIQYPATCSFNRSGGLTNPI